MSANRRKTPHPAGGNDRPRVGRDRGTEQPAAALVGVDLLRHDRLGLVYTILFPAWPLIIGATPGVLGFSTRANVQAEIDRFDGGQRRDHASSWSLRT